MEIDELSRHIRYSHSGIDELIAKGIIRYTMKPNKRAGKPYQRRMVRDFNLKEIKALLGIPKDRFGEKLLTAEEADEILKKHGLWQSLGTLNRYSTHLSMKGHLDSYYFKKRASKGKTVLFLEKDLMELIENSGGKLYDYRVNYLSEMIPLLAGYAGNQKDKDWMVKWLQGEAVKEIGLEENLVGWTVGARLKALRDKIPGIIRDRTKKLLELEKILQENEEMKKELGILRPAKEEITQRADAVENWPITVMDLGTRNLNICKERDIVTIRDLVNYGSEKYRITRDVGKKAFDEVNLEMVRLGVKW